jgi:hypothetical protein
VTRMIALIFDAVFAYLIQRYIRSRLYCVLLAVACGIFTSGIATVGLAAFLNLSPGESLTRLLNGSVFHSLLILFQIYLYRRRAARKFAVERAIKEEIRREEADYSEVIRSILESHKEILRGADNVDSELKLRLNEESTHILIKRINEGYFRDEALRVALRILESRVRAQD